MAKTLDGGCLCGGVRYAVRAEPMVVAFCHCPSCRRSVGAPAVAWAMFPLEAFAYTAGKPAVHESSPGVARTFCGACGTSLAYTADALPDRVDVTVASFDDPAALPPQLHIWESTRIPWLETADDLPRHSEFPPQP